MSESIEKTVKSVDSSRCVGIEITNKCSSHILTEPEIYIHSGKVHKSPDGPIHPAKSGACFFKKGAYSFCGVAGLLSYCFGNTQFIVLFSNPYNYYRYNIEYALYIPDTPTATNKSLYTMMYDELPESDSFTKTALGKGNASLDISKKGIYVSATMSNKKKAILEIDIRDA